jgi:hypothetical protein
MKKSKLPTQKQEINAKSILESEVKPQVRRYEALKRRNSKSQLLTAAQKAYVSCNHQY